MKKRLKISFNAPVTLGFAFLALVVLFVSNVTNGMFVSKYFSTYHSSLMDPLTYVRLFTHCLGHANWDHFIGNMSYILLLGPMIEEKYGSDRLMVMILATAVITGILNRIIFPSVSLCGASGICFMLIVISSVTSIQNREIPMTLILVLAIFLGNEIYDALFARDNISQFAHIIGGICGGFFGFFYLKKR